MCEGVRRAQWKLHCRSGRMAGVCDVIVAYCNYDEYKMRHKN